MGINIQIRFVSVEEKMKIERLAKKARLSISNYVRSRLDLEPIAHGGARTNGGKKKRDQKPERSKEKS